jgi:CubicO group peptidase (beta-lactamase class C family)
MGTALAVRANPPVVPADVQTAVRQRVDYGYCPGIVVGLMNTNGPAYFSYGAGISRAAHRWTSTLLFEIGSIKVFTMTLLADMAERGAVQLTDTIQTFLPEGIAAPVRSGKSITLTHLATHTPACPASLRTWRSATAAIPSPAIPRSGCTSSWIPIS